MLVLAGQGVAAALTLWMVQPAHSGWWAAGAAVLGTAVVHARARATAYRAGRAAERARCLRTLHDTALQSLETMALAGDADRLSPAETLIEVRGTARRQAALLRRSLGDLAADPTTGPTRRLRLSPATDSSRNSWPTSDGSHPLSPAGSRRGSSSAGGPQGSSAMGGWQRLVLADAVAEVIAEMPVTGPRVELVAGADLPEPEPWRRDCLRDATREALTNVVKHAGARRVVVRLAAGRGGVEVVVRDDGGGFDPAVTTPGFGTRQSITARIREAGGEATIESWPGHGTKVRLWMPGRVTITHLGLWLPGRLTTRRPRL